MRPPLTAWAPGRINLIGEHTDYSGGLAMPAAIELGVRVTVESVADGVALRSALYGAADPFAADGSGPRAEGWVRYGQAVARELDALGRRPVGLVAAIESDLPAAVGLSSSAALEVGIALALCAVAELELEPLALAQACRRAEQRAVGVPCGILDQAACVLGREGTAIVLDCATVEHRRVVLPPDAALVVVDSGVARALETSGYAVRRSELERALAVLGVERSTEVDAAAVDSLEEPLRRRLRHVVSENMRVTAFADAVSAGDLATAGTLISASHASLRDDYEVSTPELDELVNLAERAGAYGARLVGAGFGGSILALADTGTADAVAAAVVAGYAGDARAFVVHASDGAHVTTS
ncbi:MAG TPA: galactokinase family protein [Gaiellaceae bacterium]|nr:galactokinase family protein [Gaiellaceae bacterium]